MSPLQKGQLYREEAKVAKIFFIILTAIFKILQNFFVFFAVFAVKKVFAVESPMD